MRARSSPAASSRCSRSPARSGPAGACGGGLGGGPPAKLTDGKLVIAVINDQSGVYADLSGKNAVEAVNMAVEDFKAKYGENALGGKVEVLTADHQNKADVAQQKAQEFYERSNADLILDVPTSSAALAIADVAKAQQKLYINVTAATTVLTGKSCNKYTFHYAYDTYMLAQGTGVTVTQQGGKSWYIIYPNYAFGQDMESSFRQAVTSRRWDRDPVRRVALPEHDRRLLIAAPQGRLAQAAGA